MFEKWDDFENRPSCKGYSLCKIVSLVKNLKFKKTCKKRFFNHVRVVLCKKTIEKTPNVREVRRFWKSAIYSPCMMADFENRLISRTFGVSSIGFLHRTSLTSSKNGFLHVFLNVEFLTKSDYFAKAIAFAWWPIFKIVSFLEYLVFSQAVFLQKTPLTWLKNRFVACFLEC